MRRSGEECLNHAFDDPEVHCADFDSIQSAVYLVDLDGKILWWNSAAERITGYLRQDTLGRSSKNEFLGHTNGDNTETTGDSAPLALVLCDGKPVDHEVSPGHESGHRVAGRLSPPSSAPPTEKSLAPRKAFRKSSPPKIGSIATTNLPNMVVSIKPAAYSVTAWSSLIFLKSSPPTQSIRFPAPSVHRPR